VEEEGDDDGMGTADSLSDRQITPRIGIIIDPFRPFPSQMQSIKCVVVGDGAVGMKGGRSGSGSMFHGDVFIEG
jgi:hypothetical protein